MVLLGGQSLPVLVTSDLRLQLLPRATPCAQRIQFYDSKYLIWPVTPKSELGTMRLCYLELLLKGSFLTLEIWSGVRESTFLNRPAGPVDFAGTGRMREVARPKFEVTSGFPGDNYYYHKETKRYSCWQRCRREINVLIL